MEEIWRITKKQEEVTYQLNTQRQLFLIAYKFICLNLLLLFKNIFCVPGLVFVILT